MITGLSYWGFLTAWLAASILFTGGRLHNYYNWRGATCTMYFFYWHRGNSPSIWKRGEGCRGIMGPPKLKPMKPTIMHINLNTWRKFYSIRKTCTQNRANTPFAQAICAKSIRTKYSRQNGICAQPWKWGGDTSKKSVRRFRNFWKDFAGFRKIL